MTVTSTIVDMFHQAKSEKNGDCHCFPYTFESSLWRNYSLVAGDCCRNLHRYLKTLFSQYQWRIQDFPEEGTPTPRGGGAPTYNFAIVSQKLHEIERIWTPLRSATEYTFQGSIVNSRKKHLFVDFYVCHSFTLAHLYVACILLFLFVLHFITI